MEQQWSMAHAPVPLSTALNLVGIFAILLLLAAFPFVLLLTSDPLFSAGLSLILFALLLLISYRLPALLARRFAASIESDLPMALRAIGLHLKIKLPFEQALLHAASAHYASSPLWKEALAAIHSGQSVPQALTHAASRTSSLSFLRATQALIVVYEEGGSPDTLDALADELTGQQLAQVRLHSARASVGGLLFIASSCLLPAFFLLLSVTAGPLLDFHPDSLSIALFYLLLLPALNALVLMGLLLSAPSLSGAWRPKQLRAEAAHMLSSRGWPPLTMGRAALVGLALGAPALLLSWLFHLGSLGTLFSLALALSPLLAYALIEGQIFSDLASLESELPHLLLSGASASRFSLEKMLEQAQHSPSAPLRAQSREALGSLRAGTNPVLVLSNWAERTPSILLSRALGLLQVGYQTGGSMAKALRETAHDVLASFSLIQERASLLAVQRYTLLLAAGLLVPAILGLSLSFTLQLQSIGAGAGLSSSNSSSSPLPFASASNPDASLLHSASLFISLYLALNALLTAFFLAVSQGARERFVPYAALLILLSQAVWLLLAPAL